MGGRGAGRYRMSQTGSMPGSLPLGVVSGVAHCDDEAGDYVGCAWYRERLVEGALLLLHRWSSRMSETENVKEWLAKCMN